MMRGANGSWGKLYAGGAGASRFSFKQSSIYCLGISGRMRRGKKQSTQGEIKNEL
jgi:hypothetical protein